jgi:hypothetical protein
LIPAGGPAPARPEHTKLDRSRDSVIRPDDPGRPGCAARIGLLPAGQLAVYLALPFVTYIIQLVELSGVRE